jgi:hypothetical protein
MKKLYKALEQAHFGNWSDAIALYAEAVRTMSGRDFQEVVETLNQDDLENLALLGFYATQKEMSK